MLGPLQLLNLRPRSSRPAGGREAPKICFQPSVHPLHQVYLQPGSVALIDTFSSEFCGLLQQYIEFDHGGDDLLELVFEPIDLTLQGG